MPRNGTSIYEIDKIDINDIYRSYHLFKKYNKEDIGAKEFMDEQLKIAKRYPGSQYYLQCDNCSDFDVKVAKLQLDRLCTRVNVLGKDIEKELPGFDCKMLHKY